MLDIHVHRRGFFRGCDGPTSLDGICSGVKSDNFVLVLNVVVDHSFAIGHGVLRTAAHGDCGDDCKRAWIDHRSVVSLAVHGEDVFRSGIVNDAIRVAAGLDVIRDLQGLEIENEDLISATITDEASSKFAHQGNAVNSL